MAARRDQHSSHCRAHLLRSAQERSWAKMTRTKSRRRFPSDGCPGPIGDPLVCAPFLDDGMIRVQLNQASSQPIESAAVPLLPLPLSSRGRDERSSLLEGRGEGQSTGGASSASRVHKPHLDEMHGPSPCPTAPAAPAHANPRPTTRAPAPEAKSSSPPTRANPVPNSPSPAPPAASRPSEWVEEAVELRSSSLPLRINGKRFLFACPQVTVSAFPAATLRAERPSFS